MKLFQFFIRVNKRKRIVTNGGMNNEDENDFFATNSVQLKCM